MASANEPDGGPTRRLFIAIPLPSDIKAGLAALRTDLDGARWSPPANFHLTLRFLGDTPEEAVPSAAAAVCSIAFEPFEVAIRGVGTFPGVRDPRVLYARVVPDERLTWLHQQTERVAASLGFEPEGRPYRPHITLARLRRADPHKVRRAMRSMRVETAFAVNTVGLFQSELTEAGARHRLLASSAAR